MNITISMNGKTTKIAFKQRNGILNRINTIAMKESGKKSGRVKVNYGKGFENQFEFSNIDDLKRKLIPCLEKELLEYVNG